MVDKKWTVPDEVREKMSESARRSWEAGGRKAPITVVQEELEAAHAQARRLEQREAQVRELLRRHQEEVSALLREWDREVD